MRLPGPTLAREAGPRRDKPDVHDLALPCRSLPSSKSRLGNASNGRKKSCRLRRRDRFGVQNHSLDRSRRGDDTRDPKRSGRCRTYDLARTAVPEESMVGNIDPQRQSVTGKAVALLEAFRQGPRDLSLNQLAARTGLPLSTAYRIANELVASAALERAEGGGYRVGLRLWEIGSSADLATSMLHVVVPFMQDLYEVTHESVQL